MIRVDGSIQSSNLPAKSKLSSSSFIDYSIQRCMIVEVYFIDDKKNVTYDNKQVTYDAIVLGGRNEGQIISNIKASSRLGGQYNYEERIFRKASSPFNGTGSKRVPEQKGDIVYIQFVNGDRSLPIIVGCGPSPLDKDKTGATLADGPISRSEFNGVNEHINNMGEYEFIRKGGTYKSDAKYFIPADRNAEEGLEAAKELFQARLKFSDNKMLWEDPKSSILFEKKEQKWTHSVGLSTDKQPKKMYEEVIDGTNEKTIRKYKSGMTITEDGKNDKITIVTKKGTKVTIDGNADRVKAESSTGDFIDMTPGVIHVKENGGGALKLASGKVALGNSEETLQILSETLQELSVTLGNLGYTLSGAGTFASLKARIDSIKGSL